MIAAIILLSGCEAKNLYVAHDTVIGINANLSGDRRKGRLVVGYDRDFATIIPKSVDLGNGKKDVMASLGCNYIQITGANLTGYRDLVVSGDAAIELATKLDSKTKLFDCSLDEEEKES
jgi:hypothetical protein